MKFKKLLTQQEHGYVNFLVIFLLIFVSVIFISYMELGQTHFKSSQFFKDGKDIENQATSAERYMDRTTVNDLDSLFKERVSNHTGNGNQYLISINTSPWGSKLALPNSIEPFFYETFYDFSEHDFYHVTETDSGVKAYTFILEENCEVSIGSTHCRKFDTTTLSVQSEKILNVSRNETQFNFTLFNEIDGNTTIYYNGYEVIKQN